jgi:hypothetical protein
MVVELFSSSEDGPLEGTTGERGSGFAGATCISSGRASETFAFLPEFSIFEGNFGCGARYRWLELPLTGYTTLLDAFFAQERLTYVEAICRSGPFIFGFKTSLLGRRGVFRSLFLYARTL